MICDKTTMWSFATRLTNLATNTTLATATRHDFAAITISTPEAPSGNFTIKSAIVVVTARDVFTTGMDFDGVRIGVKLGAVAFDDVDQTLTLANTTDHETITVQRNATAYFQANYGTGATQTCQVGVAFAPGSASNVNNITCELFLTYEYDNGAATHCKTVEIPLQGEATSITNAYASEMGTTGTSVAPANQIPQLTGSGGLLPEAGIAIQQCYLRFTCLDGNPTAVGVTSFNLFMKIDSGGAELTRATLEQTLSTNAAFRDIVDLVAYGMSTTAAHAVYLRSSLTGTFHYISAVLVVTYTFTASGTTRTIQSVRVPMVNERTGMDGRLNVPVGFATRITALLDVQGSGTLTLLQSGVVFMDNRSASGTITCWAPGQAARNYTGPSGGGVIFSGTGPWIRRCDHDSSTWAIVAGLNRLSLDIYSANGLLFTVSAYAIINYTADVPAVGLGAGNRTVFYDLADHSSEQTTLNPTVLQTPSFPTTPWYSASPPALYFGPRGDIRNNPTEIGFERLAGEDSGGGWVSASVIFGSATKAVRKEMVVPAVWFKTKSYDAGTAPSMSTSRKIMLQVSSSSDLTAQLWITYHSLQFTVAGNITINGAAPANGKTVKVYAVNDDGSTDLVASVLTTGGTGAFSAKVPQRTKQHFAVYDNDGYVGKSALQTPA